MTDDETLKQAYILLIENECNRTFDVLPADIEYILLPYLLKTHNRDQNVKSQSASDISTTFATDGLPTAMRRIIQKYRRVYR